MTSARHARMHVKCVHLTSHVGKWQALCKQCRPTECSINYGMPVWIMLSAHQLGKWNSRLNASDIRHHFWPARIGQSIGSNIQCIHTLVVVCVHRLGDIDLDRCINQATSTNDRLLQPRPVRICRSVCPTNWQHLSWPTWIIRETSANDRHHQPRCSCIRCVCAHLEGDIGQWHVTSSNTWT